MNAKLTAYVLNELSPEERAALEAEMNTDTLLREEAEEMKTFCALLQEEVAAEPEVKTELTVEQRVNVLREFTKEPEPTSKKAAPSIWRHPAFLIPTAIAACTTTLLVVQMREKKGEHLFAATERAAGALKSESRANQIPEAPKEAVPTTPLLAQTGSAVIGKDAGAPANPNGAAPAPGQPAPAIVATTPAGPTPSAAPAAPAKPAPVLLAAHADAPLTLPTTAPSPLPPPPPLPAPASRMAKSRDAAGGSSPDAYFGRSMTGDYALLPEDDADGSEEKRARLRRAGGESYTRIQENPFEMVPQQPLSTFSIDVDTASYANVRRFLNNGQRPPVDAVRLEELINYFPYHHEAPEGDEKPFSVRVDMAEAPWQPEHRLVRISLKGREIRQERGPANFVFLVDVSGSMNQPDKLPLVKQSLLMLTEQITGKDRVAIVTYAGESGVALASTLGGERDRIRGAIQALRAGGSTNGAGGIRLAYEEAAKHFIKDGVNRVVLCTDGDFNVGISKPEELERLITEKAKSRIFLSVLGYGTGNLKDRTMETLADKGNGNYAYIDSLSEARKVLVDQMHATLVTIAKDVKIQVEFNPSQVASYRLLGYENRLLATQDFNNDRKDAGEIGAGHTVTALYEIVPVTSGLASANGRPMVDPLKYAPKAPVPASPAPDSPAAAEASKETLTVKLRYKQPEGDKSELIEVPVTDTQRKLADADRDFQFAASVAGFGMLLRSSPNAGELTWDMVRDLALRGKGEDAMGYRGEFLQLIEKARGLTE